MKAPRWFRLAIGIVVLMFLVGCAGFTGNYGDPGGVKSGTLVGDIVYPAQIHGHTEFHLDSGDFEILQTVEAETSSTNVLGLFSNGDNGYAKLFEKARSIGADDVINIKVDTRRQRYLSVFFVRATTIITGTAIRWKE